MRDEPVTMSAALGRASVRIARNDGGNDDPGSRRDIRDSFGIDEQS